MSPTDSINSPLSHPGLDKVALKSRGWAEFFLPASSESELRVHLINLASALGEPAETRPGSGVFDELSPTVEAKARAHSLSKQHDISEFPLHIDTAHWVTPCRYIVLACIRPGFGNRTTLLLDTQNLNYNSN